MRSVRDKLNKQVVDMSCRTVSSLEEVVPSDLMVSV